MKHTNKRYGLLIVLTVSVILMWFFFYEPEYHGRVSHQDQDNVLLFAHRGYGKFLPDNALKSGVAALDEGFDGIDVDGQLSKDGVPVIFHDLSVDRLTEGAGRVADLTAAELLELDLGIKFSSSTIKYNVATIEKFVEDTKDKGILMIELKVPGMKDTGFEKKVVDILAKHERFEDVYLSSFNPLVLWRLKRLDERVHTVLIFMDTNWNPSLLKEIKKEDLVNLPWPLRQEWIRRGIRKIIKPDLLSVNHEVSSATVDRLLERGWPIFLWTPNTEVEIKSALQKKPYGLISDEVYMMRTAIE